MWPKQEKRSIVKVHCIWNYLIGRLSLAVGDFLLPRTSARDDQVPRRSFQNSSRIQTLASFATYTFSVLFFLDKISDALLYLLRAVMLSWFKVVGEMLLK